MEFYQLAYFQEVAKAKSYTKAAKQMHVSQPTISIAVHKLEEELGVTLFVKKSNPVVLTEIGKQILEKAVSVTTEIQNIETLAREYQRKEDNLIRFGLPMTLGSEVLIRLKTGFLKTFPDIHVDVFQHPMPFLSEQLAAQEIDLALISSPVPYSNIQFKHLKNAELYGVFSNIKELENADALTPDLLKDQNLIVFGDPDVKDIAYYVRHYINDNDILAQMLPLGVLTPFSALRLAEENVGIAVLEQSFAGANGHRLTCIPFDPPLIIPIVIAWNSRLTLTESQKKLIRFLTEGFTNQQEV